MSLWRILLLGCLSSLLGGCSLFNEDTIRVFLENTGTVPITGLYLSAVDEEDRTLPSLSDQSFWGDNLLDASLSGAESVVLKQRLERGVYWLGAQLNTGEGLMDVVMSQELSLRLIPDTWVSLSIGYREEEDGGGSYTIGYLWGLHPSAD